MTKSQDKSQEMKDLLVKAGAHIRDLVILGEWVHIDTFAKYESMLRATLDASGFQIVKISDGIHMDGTSGFRMVFRVTQQPTLTEIVRR